MIAKNFIQYPEALRFQREMFSNGYHNSPRIMRLMQCIFSQAPSVPEWVKVAKREAAALVKAWKAAMVCLNFSEPVEKKNVNRVLPKCDERFKPVLTVIRGHIRCQGHYRIFCKSNNNWATFCGAKNGQYAN